LLTKLPEGIPHADNFKSLGVKEIHNKNGIKIMHTIERR
jgi:hypothetical protein